MKSIVAVGVALYLLSHCAAAFSDMEASTNSFLFSYGTDFSALRTISSNHLTTPELDLTSNGRISTSVNVQNGGLANIIQNSLFSGGRDASGYYRSAGTLFSSATGIGLSKINEEISFSGLCGVSNPENNPDVKTKVESKSLGVSMASPGTTSYLFGVQSSSTVITDAPLQKVRQWETEDPKIFTLSLETESLYDDTPMDLTNENIQFDFGLYENNLDYYDYDYSNNLVNGDTTFTSQMRFAKQVG
jgi:hypothetical protein